MPNRSKGLSRRQFVKTVGAAGMGAAISSAGMPAHGAAQSQQGVLVPTRPLGKTGVAVPILSLGGMFDMASNQLLLRQAVRMGVTYWDTAAYYPPASEEGIGKYFAKYPQDRKKIFLVTKSTLTDPDGWEFHLNKSLARMNTSYVDLFLIHMVSDIDKLAPFKKSRAWVEKQKAAGKFRLFGFSSHENMAPCMTAGAKLGWLDAMMVTYNYRILFTDEMKRAVDACVKAGIGLTAMKTQAAAALGHSGLETETASKLTQKFEKKGFTPEQARLKVVWENPHIASICSKMTNMTILKANVAAALDKTKLTRHELGLLQQYAAETRSHYCAGCSRICQATIDGQVPVGDLMRYLMYSRSYGQHQLARSLYKEIPEVIRRRMVSLDYAQAERRCPQQLPIAALIREAAAELV